MKDNFKEANKNFALFARSRFVLLLVLLIACYLRVAALDSIPNGWRDDEVIETTVHAQLILDGQRPLYFTQAAGQEPLYHYLAALFIATMGKSLFVVRLVSAFLGLLSVAASYRLAKQFFGTPYALIVALLIAVSFWSLMWSRTKVRPIAELPLMLLGFSFLFKAISRQPSAISKNLHRLTPSPFHLVILSSFFLGISLYTYFASLTIPVILIVFAFSSLLSRITPHSSRNTQYAIRQPLSAIHHPLSALLLALLLYAPLGFSILSNAQTSEGMRLNTIAEPLIALRNGDTQYAIRNTITTLQMFVNTGDPEWQSNISGRPVFNIIGFLFFVVGVGICLWKWRDKRHAFLLILLIVGIAPAFVSVPAASLSHTITALPVTYMIAALTVIPNARPHMSFFTISAAILISSIALRDIPDYFFRWSSLPEVRYLYKSDLHEQTQKLKDAPPQIYVLNGVLNVWDRKTFLLEPIKFSSPPRWVRKDWAMIFPPSPNPSSPTAAATKI